MTYQNCYYITERKPEDAHLKNATNKARADVETTFRNLGMQEIKIDIAFQGDNASIAASLKEHKATYDIWKKALKHLQKGDTLFVQVPAISHCIFLGKLFKSLRAKGIRVVLLIHDLEKLRFIESEDVPFKTRVRQQLDESSVLKSADMVIAHNKKMIEYLVSEGLDKDHLVSLEIFDYLMPEDFEVHKPYEADVAEYEKPLPRHAAEFGYEVPGTATAHSDLIIAGNLDSDKVGYLKDIGRVPNVKFQLYGVGYKDESANAVYNGSFLPEELCSHLHGNFGLVWDGTSVDTCAGNYGTYLKYNDPHKTSLYLVCGFPVVVWDQSAISGFVLQHGAGIAVSSLMDAGSAIAALTPGEYKALCENAAAVSKDLRTGHYLRTAVDECMTRLGK